ncbi:uncharacterized protein LOC118768355 [Octopus sinensis]|uniref:Uncharacterized protein LOC118768355 n=1 Tax=Octopus sinensis TaxID=2607531 RepID=A0A7E6FSG7_9MOLL|nr:uncharacterized protein LOC118768355 [Octopus sinensis]
MAPQHSATVRYIHVLYLILLPFCEGFSIDHTLIEGNVGGKIAETVVILVKSQNILMEDYSFLRRLAAVQSNDGIPFTPDKGGIWRVTTDQLETVQEACGKSLMSYCNIGQERFNVEMVSANYTELDKPLYSGYAMALYLLTLGDIIPMNLTDQAEYWKKFIVPEGNVTTFIQNTNIPEVPDQCRKSEDTPRNEVESYCLFQSPCTREAIALKIYFFAHSDPTRFIRCTEWGASFIQICVPGTVWSQMNVTCLHKAGSFIFRRKKGGGTKDKHYLNNASHIFSALLPCLMFCLLQAFILNKSFF